MFKRSFINKIKEIVTDGFVGLGRFFRILPSPNSYHSISNHSNNLFATKNINNKKRKQGKINQQQEGEDEEEMEKLVDQNEKSSNYFSRKEKHA